MKNERIILSSISCVLILNMLNMEFVKTIDTLIDCSKYLGALRILRKYSRFCDNIEQVSAYSW